MASGIKLFDLTGKRVLITGSSQGIGLTLARGLGEAGAAVIVNGRSIDKITAATQGLKENNTGHHWKISTRRYLIRCCRLISPRFLMWVRR